MKKLMNSFKSKSVRVGSYSVVSVAIILAILVAVNLLLSALPSKYTMFDLSRNLLYSFSDQTKKIVSEADMDITVYWLCQSGSENSTLEGLLDRYAAMSTRITVKKIDPDNYPTFADKYDISEVKNNSLVVESELRFRYIPYSDIFVTDYNYDDDGNYTGMTATLDGESELTSAISYVMNPNPPKVYAVTGHGETTLSDTFQQGIEAENMEYEEISLVSCDEVPEDCTVLMILSPIADLSEHEAEIIQDYLSAGGRMMLVTAPRVQERTNLDALMKNYSVYEVEGIVVEGDANHYVSRYPAYYLLPNLEESEITSPLISSKYTVFLPLSHGIKHTSHTSNVTITSLLTTSDDAFSKIASYNMGDTYEKEEGDIDGAFDLAVLIEVEDSEYLYDPTMIVWIGSGMIIDDSVNELVAGANEDLFLNAMSYLAGDVSNISIHSKNLMTKYLTVPSSASTVWSIILVGVLPVLVLTAGIVVFTRRRKK